MRCIHSGGIGVGSCIIMEADVNVVTVIVNVILWMRCLGYIYLRRVLIKFKRFLFISSGKLLINNDCYSSIGCKIITFYCILLLT